MVCLGPEPDHAKATGGKLPPDEGRRFTVFEGGAPTTEPHHGRLVSTAEGAGSDAAEGGHTLADAMAQVSYLIPTSTDPWHDAGGFFQRCHNEHPQCQEWASRGECKLNPNYMLVNCAGSCRTCSRAVEAPVYTGQPWRLFNTAGEPLESKADFDKGFEKGGIAIVFEGGQWIWPGVMVGFERTISVGDKSVTLETMALQPLVLSVTNFLSQEECDHVIGQSEPHMAPSQVSFMDKDKGKTNEEFRTSSNYFLPARTPLLRSLDERVAKLTCVPRQHQEHTQVLRYENGQYYGSHNDYWDPDFYQSADMLQMTRGGYHNRLATVFWYMTNVTHGGETNFPRAHGGPDTPNTNANCGTKGLSVHPQRGKVIVFYSLNPDGSGDNYSLHGACPVKEGTKWAANKWVWNTRQSFTR